MRIAPVDIHIRKLIQADLPSLTLLSRLAGWNQTEVAWATLMQLDPEACLGIDADAVIVATATLLCYSDQIAWLGMVLTHPDYRNRGFATRLVESALQIAIERKIRAVKLDATDFGAPIYRKLGFREEQPIERWAGRTGPAANVITPSTWIQGLNLQLDLEAFGADRSELLRSLVANSTTYSTENGFALARPGAQAAQLGPCVARSSDVARRLIGSALSGGRGDWFWDLLPSNRAATEIAQDFGFRVARRLVRMVKGDAVRGEESMIYAAGGFELG